MKTRQWYWVAKANSTKSQTILLAILRKEYVPVINKVTDQS